MILLDTHVLIWLLEDSERLGASAREAIRANTGRITLSAMTFWELSMLQSKRQMSLSVPLPVLLEKVIGESLMTIVPVTAEIAMDANSLPSLHGDPVDRLLMATARNLDCPLMTADHVVREYARAAHVQVIDARR